MVCMASACAGSRVGPATRRIAATARQGTERDCRDKPPLSLCREGGTSVGNWHEKACCRWASSVSDAGLHGQMVRQDS